MMKVYVSVCFIIFCAFLFFSFFCCRRRFLVCAVLSFILANEKKKFVDVFFSILFLRCEKILIFDSILIKQH